MSKNLVRLRCIKHKSKLRVRIISVGYNPNANCSFPKAIRVEGREYTCPASDVTFSESPYHKFFYRIKKNNIKIIEKSGNLNNDNTVDLSSLKIYKDDSDMDCCICMDVEKDSIFFSCGHFYCCGTCANTLMIRNDPCPICRAPITKVIHKSQLQ